MNIDEKVSEYLSGIITIKPFDIDGETFYDIFTEGSPTTRDETIKDVATVFGLDNDAAMVMLMGFLMSKHKVDLTDINKSESMAKWSKLGFVPEEAKGAGKLLTARIYDDIYRVVMLENVQADTHIQALIESSIFPIAHKILRETNFDQNLDGVEIYEYVVQRYKTRWQDFARDNVNRRIDLEAEFCSLASDMYVEQWEDEHQQ